MLSPTEIDLIDAYWSAANYLTVGQIYLLGNPLLREPLRPEHIKPRLLGHWGTSPGLNLIYAHLNRVIVERDLDVVYLAGPGHGGPAVVANVYLEGSYSEVYPEVSMDARGMTRLFRQFSTPGGIPSHVGPQTPGSIHEGGELGYVLSHAFGAVFDNPGLVAVAVVGDGEAETAPLEGSWKGIRFLNAARDGAGVVVDGKPEQVLDGAGTTRIAIELPRGRRLDVRIAALDARGNRVVELGSKDVPIVILGKVAESHVAVVTPQPPPPPTGKPAQPVATAGSRSILLSPWLYGALAGASLGASALFVIGAHGAASDLDAIGKDTQHHTQSEAVAVESRGRRDALLANLGLAATGAFAITAAILYATRPHDHVEILPVPVRGGAAVTLEVPF